MLHTYLVPAGDGDQAESQLIAIVADGGQIIPVVDGPGMHIITSGEAAEHDNTAVPPATSTGGHS